MKKFLIALLAVGSVAALIPAAAGLQASAASKTSVFMDEQFEESSFNLRKWNMDTASESMNLAADTETAHALIDGTNGSHVERYHLTTKESIKGLEYYQFDFAISGGWSALNFDSEKDYELTPVGDKFAKYNEYYSPEVAIQTSGLTSWNINSEAECTASTSEYGYSFMPGVWYTLRLEPISATEASITWAEQGVDVDIVGDDATGNTRDVRQTMVTLKSNADYDFTDLYIFLCTSGGQTIAVDNIRVKASNMEFHENFSDTLTVDYLEEYGVNGTGYTYKGADSYLAVESAKAGDKLIYKTPIPVEESIVTELEVMKTSFNVSFKNASSDVLAYAFGLSDMDASNGFYALVMDASGFAVKQYAPSENGLTETVILPKVEVMEFASKDGVTVDLIANKKGEIKLACSNKNGKLAEAVATIDAEEYYVGYVGFIAVQDNSGTVMIDKLNIKTMEYKIPVTKSVTHNFETDYFGVEGYEDFLMNTIPEKSQYVKDGKLVWDGTSDYTYFGSAHEYDNFILDFKLCNIYTKGNDSDINATKNGNWLGIDLGKSKKLEQQYGSYVTLMFNITRPQGVPQDAWTSTGVSLFDSDGYVRASEIAKSVTYSKAIPASYFKDIQYDGEAVMEEDISASDAVCIRLVAENGTVKLYMKKAAEMEYTLYYAIEDVETFGYTALCCTGWTYMKFDDFSMANISELYYCADSYTPETVYKTETETLYDRGNVDMNGLNETELNKDSGCGSNVSAAYAVLPIVLAAGFVLMAKTKKRGEK